MVTVTYIACKHMVYSLCEFQAPDNLTLRIKLVKAGVDIQPDKILPDDDAFDDNGKIVLVLDQPTLEFLDNKTIDLVLFSIDLPEFCLSQKLCRGDWYVADNQADPLLGQD